MFRPGLMARAATMALALGLAACGAGGASENELAALDEQLIGNAGEQDPALTGALEDQIMVDPDLAQQSNADSALPGETANGAPIPDTAPSAATRRAAEQAIAEGRLLRAPEPTPAEECNTCAASQQTGYSAAQGETTLGALAQEQRRAQPEGATCTGGAGGGAGFVYGMQWASTLPRAFDVYPGSRLIEAAGKNDPGCRVRVVSFESAASMQRLLDWYYTRAVRTGYSSEHQVRHGNHVLGGYRERDEGAYYIIFAEGPDGGTLVDIIANNGR